MHMTPTAISRTVSLCLTVVTMLVLSACGSIVDDAKTEAELTKDIPTMAESDLKVTSVNCPDDQDFTKGATFECKYTVEDDSDGVARVTVTDEQGDGELEYSIARYASGQVEQYLMTNTEADVPLTSVECPDTVEDGTTCTFEDEDGDTGKISLAFDSEGNFEATPTLD